MNLFQKNIKKAPSIALLLSLLLSSFAHGLVTLNGSGKDYPVIETSMHHELIETLKAEAEKLEENPPEYTVKLKQPPELAKEERVRIVSTTYVQPHDVVNGKGEVIVAKGTRLEPLKYFKLPVLIVVSDDPAHLKWAQEKQAEIQNNEDREVFILLSSGSAWQVAEKYHLRVYHLDDRYMNRFRIKRVPCTIRQKGLQLEIHEYP
ncbi:MAG: hypothetical protein PVI90_01530 [Desulfobacteraceae bacterium]